MTSWGAVMLGGFLYLGFRRSGRRSNTNGLVIGLVIAVLLLVAVRQHTL